MGDNGVVEISGTADPNLLLKALEKSGKSAELQWLQFGECSTNLFMPENHTNVPQDGRYLHSGNRARPNLPSQEATWSSAPNKKHGYYDHKHNNYDRYAHNHYHGYNQLAYHQMNDCQHADYGYGHAYAQSYDHRHDYDQVRDCPHSYDHGNDCPRSYDHRHDYAHNNCKHEADQHNYGHYNRRRKKDQYNYGRMHNGNQTHYFQALPSKRSEDIDCCRVM